MNAASNIFIGQAMAPLLIKPYLSQISVSEIHAILTSGFSTIAGTVMAAYINFGVSPAHLLSASVMSAPAALAAAKLLLPETEQGQEEDYDEEHGEQRRRRNSFQMSSMTENCGNLLDAATQGASSAALLVINITAIVVAFIAFVAFLNSVVGFFGGLIGFPDTTFESLLGKIVVVERWGKISNDLQRLCLCSGGLYLRSGLVGMSQRRHFAGHQDGGQRIHCLPPSGAFD